MASTELVQPLSSVCVDAAHESLTSHQVGANKSKQVTKTSSMGMWLPIHDEEWDGDVPLGLTRAPSPHRDAAKGTITFKGNTLPWLIGRYEVNHSMIVH